MCEGKDFVITMLPIGDNVRDVALGEGGIMSQNNTDLIYIDMSTILPADTIEVSKKLLEKDIQMFDAPVARLVNNAIDGTLLIMVGGSLEEFPKIEEILKCMGSDVVYCGDIGSGSKMKIINNYMAIVSNIVTAETLSLVHKSGIDQKLAIDLMSTTAAGKGHMNFSYPKKVLIDDIGPGFKNVLALKDLRLAIEHGESEGIELTSGKSVVQTERDLKRHFAKERWNDLHLQIIYYGREHCPARSCYGLKCLICQSCFPNRKAEIKTKKP